MLGRAFDPVRIEEDSGIFGRFVAIWGTSIEPAIIDQAALCI